MTMSEFLVRVSRVASEVHKAADNQLYQGALTCTYCPALGAVVSAGIAIYSLGALISHVFRRCLKSDLNALEELNGKIRDYQVLLAYNCVNIATLGLVGAVLRVFDFIALIEQQNLLIETQNALIKEQCTLINTQNLLIEDDRVFEEGGVVALAKTRAFRDFQDAKVNSICPRTDVVEEDEKLYSRTYLSEMVLLNT